MISNQIKDARVTLEKQTSKPEFATKVSEWTIRHPNLAILLISFLAVVINCYPIIFCGKSYVSPNSFGTLVYNWRPFLPEAKPAPFYSTHGSDTAAILLWGVPAGFIESRSLLQYGELPLWNRYGHAGETLVGQAVSMFGDPLQWIVIIGHGSAVAWDIKFLAAKFLFCCGFGLLILRLLGSGPLSLMYAALAAYCGAFFFINNHLVFFAFVYAPWILLSAIEFLGNQSQRHIWWGLAWLVANIGCFSGGHIETGVVLIGGLNLVAFIHALTDCRTFAAGARVLGRMMAGTLLFLGLTAPVWMAFIGTLAGSYSAHMEVQVFQLPFQSLLGAFDDMFFLLFRLNENMAAVAPGSSFLVLIGCILSAFAWRQFKADHFFWINSGAIVWWAGCIFGGVPASLLAAIPLLNRVGHTQVDFSYVLIIHLTIQSAYGFKSLTGLAGFRRPAINLLGATAVVLGMAILFGSGRFPHGPIPWDYVMGVTVGAVTAPLLYAYLKSRGRKIPVLGWVGIIVLGFIPQFRFGLYTSGDDKRLILPGPRDVLNAPSPALEKIKADHGGAYRVVGMDYNLHGNYAAVYGLEDIRSCAPLSSGEFISLIRNSPGMTFSEPWIINVADPVTAQPLLNLLNVKYLLASPKIKVGENLDYRVVDRSDFGVLENLDVWPRAFFSDKVIPISSTPKFIQYLYRNPKSPFIAMTDGEIAKQAGLQPLESTKTATISPATSYELLPNSTAIDVHAPSAGLVCLTESMAPDFVAEVNHQTEPVLTVNRAFKGVYLDKPGDYHIEFIYRPHHWRLACTIFWTAIGVATALAVMSLIRARGRRKSATSDS